MESKGKIEIIQTGITTAKVFLNGQDISNVVSGYTITHEANKVAKLELIIGKPFTDVIVDEICEVLIRDAEPKEVVALDFSEDIDKPSRYQTSDGEWHEGRIAEDEENAD